ncbi:hypothetical protein DAPPUDRAFT_253787 [Daphnia pulex]|uniref:Uncharacterized protein n=1 Tax=Daphnia pulex TaxID=6669 RepID=E9H5E8_DAPPU|nr:hypothetical protein DAPPUDRAFT_253787 [Daphnia pulex]|eukprot:EFX72950.1 hypothetical protein DAPPUDRAFT_253787 [Daphnia pulex]
MKKKYLYLMKQTEFQPHLLKINSFLKGLRLFVAVQCCTFQFIRLLPFHRLDPLSSYKDDADFRKTKPFCLIAAAVVAGCV